MGRQLDVDILEWIKKNYPGKMKQFKERIEIVHDDGTYSTIWLNTKFVSNDDRLKRITYLYKKYNGMDLFSSTFKVAAIDTPKSKNNVELVQNIAMLTKDINFLHPEFPEKSIPFMYQTGIGFYAIGIKSGKIYEWDEEDNELSGEYESVQEILDEWLKAITF